MSVLQCDRYGCDNIMCDKTIMENEYYICDDCYKELMDISEKIMYRENLTMQQIKKFIFDFMEDINNEENCVDEDIHSSNKRMFRQILDERDRRDERWRDN